MIFQLISYKTSSTYTYSVGYTNHKTLNAK